MTRSLLTIGLTGGIATGKSLVAAILREAGARVIDADRLAREVVSPGTPAFEAIVRHFGPEVLGADGAIDRARLARIVFSDTAARTALNAIVHPRVAERMAALLSDIRAEDPAAMVFLEVPLLYETGMEAGLDGVIVVSVPEALQIERLMARDGIVRQEALLRIRAQMPLAEKRRRASVVIDNSVAPEATRAAVLETLARFREDDRMAP